MLMNSDRLVVATCPECAEVTKKQINIFSFSGGKPVVLSCPHDECHAPMWEIREMKDKNKISVNCPACDETHTYTLTKRTFWGKNFFALNCPAWEVGILYVGDDEKYIDSQIDIQNDNISDILEGIADLDDSFTIMYDLIECINELAKSDNVECTCPEPDVKMLIDDEKITLICKSCGRKKEFRATEDDLNLIMKTSTIVLDDINFNNNEED